MRPKYNTLPRPPLECTSTSNLYKRKALVLLVYAEFVEARIRRTVRRMVPIFNTFDRRRTEQQIEYAAVAQRVFGLRIKKYYNIYRRVHRGPRRRGVYLNLPVKYTRLVEDFVFFSPLKTFPFLYNYTFRSRVECAPGSRATTHVPGERDGGCGNVTGGNHSVRDDYRRYHRPAQRRTVDRVASHNSTG